MKRLLICPLILLMTPALAQDPPPEPFETVALLQSCNPEGDGAGCSLYGDGVRYTVWADGDSDPGILAQLAKLPLNAPVKIAGQILSLGDISAEVVLTTADATAEDPHAKLRADLQGRWVNAIDPAAGLWINGSEWTTTLNGNEVETSLMQIGGHCGEGIENDGPPIILRLFGGDPADHACLDVAEIAADRMQLVEMPRAMPQEWRRAE